MKLAESSRPLTTFVTPWGRYCFNVLPYGISSGSEKFQKCMSRILEGLEGVECNIDECGWIGVDWCSVWVDVRIIVV